MPRHVKTMEHATILRITTVVIALINLRDKIVKVSLTKIEIQAHKCRVLSCNRGVKDKSLKMTLAPIKYVVILRVESLSRKTINF